MTRAPTGYWVCLATLVVANSLPGFLVYLSVPVYGDAIDMIASFLAIAECFLAALALVFRRRIAVALLVAAFVFGGAGLLWAVTTQGLDFDHAGLLMARVVGLGLVLAIVFYCRQLVRRGFLR